MSEARVALSDYQLHEEGSRHAFRERKSLFLLLAGLGFAMLVSLVPHGHRRADREPEESMIATLRRPTLSRSPRVQFRSAALSQKHAQGGTRKFDVLARQAAEACVPVPIASGRPSQPAKSLVTAATSRRSLSIGCMLFFQMLAETRQSAKADTKVIGDLRPEAESDNAFIRDLKRKSDEKREERKRENEIRNIERQMNDEMEIRASLGSREERKLAKEWLKKYGSPTALDKVANVARKVASGGKDTTLEDREAKRKSPESVVEQLEAAGIVRLSNEPAYSR
eukprot:gnl/TRDRNA2_/TRDRNA2_82827_c0_seq2.p1 gnl/TRDRNA2_/TRDRNA2_82827_c0~~gnl/TRDRNA2_/TRDRNA2_82827_c0_seq2.p1  ORF type:complete len:282 (-),score=49.49 gnl/TRDRNA2_/TRDRNA2_82827_c0_seq2:78-923(-)